MNYKRFPNLHIQRLKGHIGIFHPLTRRTSFFSALRGGVAALFDKKAQGGQESGERGFLEKVEPRTRRRLMKEKILVQEDYDYDREIELIRERIIYRKPRLRIAYFIISELCNLRCKYCHVVNDMPSPYKKRKMSQETALECAIFFAFHADREGPDHPKVFFYGGEPLLNINALELVINIIRKYESRFDPVKRSALTVVTNGVLVTDKIAKFLSRSNIAVSVSLDGFNQEHNRPRIKRGDGLGSFQEALNGYRVLKRRGVHTSISCTIGQHNVSSLEQIAAYFGSKAKPSAVTFNIMYDSFNRRNPYLADMGIVSSSLIRGYEILRRCGVQEDRIGRHLTPEEDLRFYPYECGGYGDQLVFLPDGSIGPCHGHMGTREYFFANVMDKEQREEVLNHPVLFLWRSRSPFNMKECRFCPAISICGGGCAYQAELKRGSFFEKDERACVFFRRYFLKWHVESKYKEFLQCNSSESR
jgi:uncharacterized protein